MVIQHNISAIKVHRNMMVHNKNVSKYLERLSSGSRINRAADDAAGLAISEKMRSQIRGMDMSRLNVLSGISMLQTAEGGLNEMHAIAQRMRELATQSANGTYSDEDRENLNKEFNALKEEITRISDYTNYNGIKLLDGSTGAKNGQEAFSKLGVTAITFTNVDKDVFSIDLRADGSTAGYATLTDSGGGVYRKQFDSGTSSFTFDLGDGKSLTLKIDGEGFKNGVLKNIAVNASALDEKNIKASDESGGVIFQIGVNGTADQRMSTYIGNMASHALGEPEKGKSLEDASISTREEARDAIGIIDTAINQISSARAGIGAQINRLGHTLSNIETSMENMQAAESRIRDVDMAEAMMEFVKHNILLQAAQAIMAQAMNGPEAILQLLKQ